ncbi:MAG: protein kinase, partial [bacterium]|nr:protein kinase [bacterium]
MENNINEIEREFRRTWRSYDPLRYQRFLQQVSDEDQPELLARLIGTEIEYSYQPPTESLVPAQVACDGEDRDNERIRPTLNILLAQYPTLARSAKLVIRLCVLEYALRLRHDPVPPNPESYLGLCPHSQDHLYQLLQRTEDRLPARVAQTNAAKSNDSTVKDDSESSAICLDRLPNNLGCFLLIDLISRGGMGFVYSAIDLRSAAPVAVKVMRRDDAWSIYRFIEEFSWLSQVDHPNLVKLYDAFAEGDLRYFSMELVEGRNVHEWFRKLRRERSNPWSSLKKVLAQAASALQFLHDKGVIHCDIKCSNLMITARRRAVLLDLGLAIRVGSRESGLGTLQYAAPEVLSESKHSTASDWYSFGLMIYEILAGKFDLKTVTADKAEQDRNHHFIDLDNLRWQLKDTDPELVELCCDLLASDPKQRPCGADVLRRLGSLHFPYVSTDHYVDRHEIFEALNGSLKQSLTEAAPQVVVVQGESGIGKTAAVERWLRSVDLSESLVLFVRCFRQDHTPLRLLNGLVQQLVQMLSSQPPSWWRPLLDSHLQAISESFPQVRQLVDVNLDLKSRIARRAVDLSEQLGVRHLIQFMVDLSHEKRFLIVIDDAQWADSQSLWWISQLLAHANFRGLAVANEEGGGDFVRSAMNGLFEASRPDTQSSMELAAESRLQFTQLELQALTPEQSRQLLAEWSRTSNLTNLSSAVENNILDRANGNPFLLKEMFLAHIHHVKQNAISDEAWLDSDSHRSLHRRFAFLQVQAENVLQFLAVATQPLSFHQLQIVTRILPDELQGILSLLASQGWIHSRSKDFMSDIEIAHDKFRRAILASLPKDRYLRRHFRMARMLSTEVPPAWARMGEHYWNAEQFREAAACYLQAAQRAVETGSFHEALSFLERANHADADRKPEEAEQVAMLEADCLAALGNSRKAAIYYDRLHQFTLDQESKLLYRCLAGEQWIRAGQLDSGLKYLDDTLRRLGITRIQSSRVSHLALRFKILLHQWSGFSPRATENNSQVFGPLERTLSRVSIPLTFLDNQLGPDLIVQFKKFASARGSEPQQAVAFLHYALLLSFGKRKWLKPAMKWLRSGRSITKQHSTPTVCGNLYFVLFAIRIQQGRLAAAARYAQRGIQYYSMDVRSRQWELQFLQWSLLGCYWDSMQLQKLRESCLEYRQSATERSDSMSQYFMHVSAAHWADLVVDDAEGAQASLTIAENAIFNQTFQSPRFFLWLSQVVQLLYEGRVSQANDLLNRDWAQLRNAYLFGTNHYRWYALRVRLCCQLALYQQQPSA